MTFKYTEGMKYTFKTSNVSPDPLITVHDSFTRGRLYKCVHPDGSEIKAGDLEAGQVANVLLVPA